jgi:hypothetical protein
MGLDKDAVAYYRKYFNQVDGGSEFVSALVKEHAQAKVQDQMDSYKIKLARAYELSYDMVSRGMCLGDSASIAAQADEIMNFNDESFNTLKRVVAQRSPIAKTAGHMPQVGLNSAGDSRTVSTHSLVDELGEALSKTTKGMF